MEKRGKTVGELAVLLLVLNYIHIFRTILEKRGKEVGALAVLFLFLNYMYLGLYWRNEEKKLVN